MAVVSTPQQQYHVVAHQSALSELHSIPTNIADEIKTVLKECSRLEQPSSHSKCKLMRQMGMFRISCGKYRALADVRKPYVRCLLVDHREYCYERQKEALERQRDH